MLAKYGSIQLLGKFLPGIISFFVASALTRLLPPEQFGVYGIASAVSQLVALAAFGWVGLSVMRLTTGRQLEARFVGSVIAVFGAIVLVVCAGSALSLLLPIVSEMAQFVGAVVFGCIVFAYFDLKSSFYTASFDFLPLLLLNLTRTAISGAATIVVAGLGGSGLAAFFASSATMLAVCILWRRRSSRIAGLAVDWQVVKRICAFGLPIAGGLLLFAATGWSDRLVLSVQSGAAAVGFYTAGTLIIQNTLQFASQAIGSAAYPLAVLAYESGNRWTCDRQLEQNFIALVGFLLPASIGLSILAPNIAEVLVGQEYREAVINLTPLLAAAAVISGIRGNFVDHSFQLTSATWHYMGISADMTIVNIAALLLLVPHYGYMGAGAACLLTAVVGLVHALVASRRVYRIPFPMREVGKVMAAALAMSLALGLVAQFRGAAALLGQIGGGLFVYGIVACGLNLLNVRHSAVTMLVRRRADR